MTINQPRQVRGIPIGGQFRAVRRPEGPSLAGPSLAEAPDDIFDAIATDIGADLDAHGAPDDNLPDDNGQVASSERPRFVLSDNASADWAMRKLAKARAEQASVSSLADEQKEVIMAAARRHLEPIEAWERSETERLGSEAAYFEGLLTTWHRDLLLDDSRAKTVRLPHGDLHARKSPDRFDVNDPEAFVAWASQVAPGLVRTKVEPDKVAMRSYFAATATEEAVVDPVTGELVASVRFVPGETRFSVTPNGLTSR